MNELVRAARSGSQRAVSELIDRLSPIRKSLINQYSGLDSDDLDQELTLVLLDCINSYDEDMAAFSYYVKMMSYYYCLDKAKSQVVLSLDIPAGDEKSSLVELLVSDENTEKSALELRDRDLINQIIKVLSTTERRVLYLLYYKGLNLSEIGGYMGYSTTHAGRIRDKALRSLRRECKKRGYNKEDIC